MRSAAIGFLLLAAPSFAADKISLSLHDVPLSTVVRMVYSEMARKPYMLTPDVMAGQGRYSLDLRDVPLEQALKAVDDLARSTGHAVETRAGVRWIAKAPDAGPESEDYIVYQPRYRSSRYLSDVVQSVTSARSLLARSIRQDVGQPAGQGASPPQAGQQPLTSSRTSAEGQVDRSEVDQVAFSVPVKDSAKVRKLLQDLDTPTGELVLKAAVYEVRSDKSEGSAVQLALSLSTLSGSVGQLLAGGATIKVAAGGLDVVLSALDNDSRFRSISRPQVRVKNGAQARFSVGQDVPVLGSVQIDRSGQAVQSVEYKQSGVILSATPEIRQDVIELQLSQELSNFVQTQTGVNNSPTLLKRQVNTKLGIQPGEVVILAGLEGDETTESGNRLPFFGWLLGESRKAAKSEILVLLEVVRI